MTKVFETFEHDIKRKFDDVMTVEDSDSIKAIDIEEYVLTQNVEEILGNFVAYFFDDEKEYPELRMKTQLLQDIYRDKIGPGVWIRGFFGAGKSHLLKVIYTIFSKKEIFYIDENGIRKELNVVDSICSKIRSPEVTELVKNIHSEDYLTFIFSANHIAKSGDTVVDCLPKEISRQLNLEYDEDKTYSAMDVAEFLKSTRKDSGKKRMLIFIDEILDLLDNADKVRKFEGLVELLPNNIWMIVTSLEAKTKLLDIVSAERMIHRFGEEQILKPEEMVRIVKNRYLAKNEKCSEIESIVNIEKMKYIFGTALYTATEDGKIEIPNVIASYPFYPFQLAYMKDMLKNESKGSARNMMKTIKSIMKRPEVYNQEVGYFVGTDLIYDELKSKRSIEDEYSDLIASLESDPVLDDKQNPIIDKRDLLTVLKAIVLLSQVKAEGVKDIVILPFVYSDRIPNKDAIKLLKTIDNNIMVNQKLKDVAENIRNLMSKLKGAKLDIYSSIVTQEIKDDVAYVGGLASDILGRKDAEDTIVGFNSLVSDTATIDRFRKVLFIVDNSSNISVSYKVVSLMETCNCKDKEQAVEAGKRFIEGDNKQFDALKKLYVLAFNQTFDHYKNTYDGYVREIQKMDEWSNIDDEQKKKVLDELESIEIKSVVISQDLINATGLGTLEKLMEKQGRLQSSFAKAVTKLHVFNDENNAPKEDTPTPTPVEVTDGTTETKEQPKKAVQVRITRTIGEYMPKNRVINVDGEEGIDLLDSVFEEIRNQIWKDLKDGKKITLQL